jgi:hypothetical protein
MWFPDNAAIRFYLISGAAKRLMKMNLCLRLTFKQAAVVFGDQHFTEVYLCQLLTPKTIERVNKLNPLTTSVVLPVAAMFGCESDFERAKDTYRL